MKKSILTFLLLFVIVAVSQAQIAATVARTDRVADPGTRLGSYVYSFTNTLGATETVAIDVSDKSKAVIQIYSGSTTSGFICDATMVPFWVGASPMNPGSSVASTYTKYASQTVIPMSANTAITTCTPTIYSYGLYNLDVAGLGKIKIGSLKAADVGTTITVVVTTK